MARMLAAAVLAVGVAGSALAHPPRWSWGWGVAWWPWWGWWVASAPGVTPRDVAVVDTDVSPEEARVLLDGKVIGVADDFDGYPGYLLLEPGTYELEFALPGYASEKVTLEARAGRYYTFDHRLQRSPGEGRPPRYERPPRPVVGQVFGKEAPARTGTGPDLSLRPDLEARPRAEGALPRRGAALDLRVEPGHASVYLDGEFLGTGQELAGLRRGVAVGAGVHTVEVFAPGHAARRVEVEVAEGEVRQVVVELEPASADAP